ncbi:Melibiose/raffinose/stachyose import permease protein MelD [Paraburkholderia aspalathi]|uniref:carbohydrate ABC transporter permease n=1 Tax=Paraburkholderia aspalathi TaxID=1324617 RepID=UPI00190DBD99|nr:sugar ABC transporter permease [Paraburkholderia aspalathi]MBK3842283.1 sugar ABC transporter permease [Paraburkholderia aspalathi]CAE6827474.1 Melibiose/raffinose/stachyose import permease protein MelD [Paraburkholderia aspalathi]CAE6832790.1 Melibiose/raffinose/stachyose import permease protein MelD [Paraburkholderia aspalathi]
MSQSIGTRRQLAMLSMPAVVFTALMIAFPFFYTIWLSFEHFSLGGTGTFNGGRNYLLMVQDAQFWNGLKITLLLYVMSLVLQLIFGTYVAVLLHSSKKLWAGVRALMVSPFVLPPVVVGMMWLVILDPSIGVANWLLSKVGLPPSTWLASPQWVIPTVAMIDSWQWTPYVALIVLGGLQSLPPSVYEAAQIDGSSRWQTFRRITLPLLLPTLVTATILRSVDLLRFFDIIYITTQGGPGNASNTLNIYGFQKGFEFFDIGYASALMITLSVIVLGAVLVLTQMRKRVAL